MSVCLSVCLSASASRRLGSVSLNLHLFLSLSLLTPGLPRVLWLWPWLPRLRRPAVSRGVGACECLCVCPCACMSLVRSLRKVLCLEGGVGARGASVGRRGGADELWFTALVAPGGFGHRAGAGQDGRSGPRLGCAQARRRLRGPRAPAGPRGHAALSSEALGGGEVAEGGGGLRAGAGLEGPRVGERPDLRAPHPTAPLTPPQPSPAQPSPALPWMCVLPCASGCLSVLPFFGRKGSVRASCPLRSSGVVSLLEVEVSDALIGVGQKSPFCDMLVLSPYIRACARTRQTDRQTDTHTHTLLSSLPG